MNKSTKKILQILKVRYNLDLSDVVIETDDDLTTDYIIAGDKLYIIYENTPSVEDTASYIAMSITEDNENNETSEYLNGEFDDPWLLNGEPVTETLTEEIDDVELDEENQSKELQEKYSTSQAKILDELTYLISTEYEAIKWYDEAIPMIQASGMDEDLISSTILGIEEIRKDEEDHVAHIERLIKQIKENRLIEGTNGNE